MPLSVIAVLSAVLLLHGVGAYYSTSVQSGQIYSQYQSGYVVANYGTTTDYGYSGPAPDTHPQFYSAIESHAVSHASSGNCLSICGTYNMHITVSGTDPNGNPLTGDKLGCCMTAFFSPQSNAPYQDVLNTVYQVLLNAPPYGILASIVNANSHPWITTGYDASSAWADWQYAATPTNQYIPIDAGLDFGYQLSVDPTLPGTYNLHVHYHIVIDSQNLYEHLQVGSQDLDDYLSYTYAPNGFGFGVSNSPSTLDVDCTPIVNNCAIYDANTGAAVSGSTITLVDIGGSGTVTMSASSLPCTVNGCWGLRWQQNPVSLVPGQSVNDFLTITAPYGGTTSGVWYYITVTGTSATSSQTTTISIFYRNTGGGGGCSCRTD